MCHIRVLANDLIYYSPLLPNILQLSPSVVLVILHSYCCHLTLVPELRVRVLQFLRSDYSSLSLGYGPYDFPNVCTLFQIPSGSQLETYVRCISHREKAVTEYGCLTPGGYLSVIGCWFSRDVAKNVRSFSVSPKARGFNVFNCQVLII